MAMGKQSLLDFLGDWRVCPLHTFRHGFQRTWIVRSAQEPIEKLIPHDFGLAVINESMQRKSPAATERFQPPRTKADFLSLSNRFMQGPSHAQKSWVGVVVGDSSSAISSQKKVNTLERSLHRLHRRQLRQSHPCELQQHRSRWKHRCLFRCLQTHKLSRSI